GWSFANTIVKLTRLPVLEFTFWRLWLGAAIMIIALFAAGRRLTWPIVRASAPSGVLFALNLILFFTAFRKTGIADALVIQALQPAITLLVAGRMFGERATRREVALVAVSVAGVTVSVLGSSSNPVWSLQGDLFAVWSLLVWTAYFLLSKRIRATVQAVEYMTTVTVVAAVAVTPVVLIARTPLGGFRPADWMW